MDFSFTAAGFMVGLVVGLTGVGGGALMTPLLIFIFGVAPKTAIGTDLFFAALTKVFGVLVHGRHGTIDWQVFRRLSSGSVPAALVTVAVLQWLPVAKSSLEFLLKALSVALFVTALGLYFKGPLYASGRRRRLRAPESFKVIQLPLTVLAGIVLGVMVSLTSIGFIGQIARHKGPDILIEAFKWLPRGAAELHIYGPPDQDLDYVSRLKVLSEWSTVQFRGTFPRERMGEVMASLDLLVIPSRWYENSPLVLLNALAMHTPVAVSDLAGMTEFLDAGRNGFSFQRGSVDDLERALRELLIDQDKLYSLPFTTEYGRTNRIMAQETPAMCRG